MCMTKFCNKFIKNKTGENKKITRNIKITVRKIKTEYYKNLNIKNTTDNETVTPMLSRKVTLQKVILINDCK